ncbi:MAG: fibronectin type III domain-containing protein [Candidatus Marinimicrobia bacterium]|nr:fibronectin type III domain-containing protein [Candidatus Neomarinimicrobiota bacterium]
MSSNTANSGGGLYMINSDPALTGVTVTGNTAYGSGGGLYMSNSDPALMDVTVNNNTANNGGGGGLYISYYSDPALTGVTVTGNTASTGGGLYIGGDSGVLLWNVTITGNSGGIYVESGAPTIAGSNIAYNGTGLYNLDNSNTIDADSVWWGHSSGPYHLGQNPGGLGDSANAYVDITPFLTEPDTAAPPIPVQNLVVTNTGDDFIDLAWDSSPMSDLAGYKVYYDTDSTGIPYADTVDVGADTTYTLSGFPLGTIFYLAVTCYDTDGNESWYSSEVNTAPKDITAPAAPQNLTVMAANESVTLTWDQNTEVDFLRYRIYGGTSPNPTLQVDSSANIADTAKTIGGLVNDTTYYYRVSAVDDSLNESGYSNEVDAIPFNTPPGAFALLLPMHDSTLAITNANLGDTLTFAWEAAVDVDGDTVRYGAELTDGLGALFTFGDTTATEVRLPYAAVAAIMESVGQLTITGTWDIFAADGEDSTWASNGPFTFTIDATTLDVLRQALLPQQFALHQNYPNPFNPSTTIRFDLPAATEVHLAVYDLLGREVVRLVDGQLQAGYHQQVWNGRDLNGREVPTGIYFVLVVTPEFRKSIKVVLLK